MEIVLASTSKFKSEILSRCHIKHKCMSINYEENSNKSNYKEYVMELALGKAECLRNLVNGIIIGIDNVVVMDGKIIEKPRSLEEARCNLINSSNNLSNVICGLAIIDTINHRMVNTYVETLVYFNNIDDEDMLVYLYTFISLKEKAGN
jgi:septum formation protein